MRLELKIGGTWEIPMKEIAAEVDKAAAKAAERKKDLAVERDRGRRLRELMLLRTQTSASSGAAWGFAKPTALRRRQR